MVPVQLQREVLKTAHETILSGHMGIQRTKDRVLSHFYWPGVFGDVTRFCRSCDIGQRTVPKGRVVMHLWENFRLLELHLNGLQLI